ncbi:uncharacterized protein N7477_000384 [Penicillium maclennaniae]|uniref:uncharacterized protein n=1 Tax=Penicillium maclennaniae TaxID=1343394 RepID=UPI00253FDB65|nr:uncharacterized protein N7477_000384 [Penicillium maclennaniae]KAJ5684039.1 hypothetical protein N7477_000384 [Penicillium maclennaniae]
MDVWRNARTYTLTPHVSARTAAFRGIVTTSPIRRLLYFRRVRRSLRRYKNGIATRPPPIRILHTIEHEHRALENHAHKILNSADPDERTRYQNLLTWELARHIVSEELVVYPALAKHVDDGQDRADKRRIEHQTIKEQLNAFQGLRATDPRSGPTLEALLDDLKYHFEQEESSDLPALEDVLSQADSEALTKSLDRTKMFVPSRSHPLAPDKPPFETAVGLLTAPIDMVADIFRKWPHREKR